MLADDVVGLGAGAAGFYEVPGDEKVDAVVDGAGDVALGVGLGLGGGGGGGEGEVLVEEGEVGGRGGGSGGGGDGNVVEEAGDRGC